MKRYELIDTLRGFAIVSMIAFHTCWILHHFGLAVSDEMLTGTWFTVWERSICISFILIAGFSFSLGHNHLRSGLVVFVWGVIITAATCLFIPGIRIVFGILTFIGTATLLMILIDRLIGKATKGSKLFFRSLFILSLVMFLFTYNINIGYVGLNPIVIKPPQALYKGLVPTFIGFMEPGFVSDDYFSIMPWFFLYLCGYSLHKLIRGSKAEDYVRRWRIPGIDLLGRHSLPIYLVHPVIIYIVIWIAA